jgi:hypothetical protein
MEACYKKILACYDSMRDALLLLSIRAKNQKKGF